MRAFAELLDRLVLTPQRNGKLRLLVDYFRTTPDPDRGLALAAITRDLELQSVKPAMLRALMTDRSDPTLFAYSYDYVGDLAETISLIWPGPNETPAGANLPLSVVVHELQNASRREGPLLVASWLDVLGISERYALLKLVTGGLRIGVSARLAKQALANFGDVDVVEIEELWHGQVQPYTALFDWLEDKAPKPAATADAPFRPVMLATALDEADIPVLDPSAYSAEWKWDGIRVQAVSENGVRRLYSRTGDDISGTFPDVLEAMDFEGSIDGELLVGHHGETGIETATFSDLQQRLNRKTVTAKQLREYPAFVRAYDLLQDGTQKSGEDLRTLPFAERRVRLARFIEKLDKRRFDLSPVLEFSDFSELAKLRLNPPHPVIEGLMLKRHDSTYVPGRPKGPWFKWKRDPFTIDAVVVYAQRGHGKRSSYYSDFTFAVWTGPEDAAVLVPVGKAYFGFTDEELKLLDKFVRENTIERFGPVRSVRAEPDHGLVVEVAFEGLNRSTRHKSGVAMRFPRFSRLRWDKPPREADRLETLEKLLS
ncbi:cisplatin damage response ATP-dependent DNA ligase [Brucella pseudogrignonensis]|uniref:cisplatin damage response ATP-dependent DNA ligase n=1 Tax=Brucella pseudogrignonensis TaxID=419475 RepID=UPI0028B67285|nr:cisplatin damage response ATP-dependent DNA ligase [Brucella pseudogrignonensis]MDT6941142.1 cisplatin damage response ATP-dependent DNA ligase [Brucella pseudogrignonensis]